MQQFISKENSKSDYTKNKPVT